MPSELVAPSLPGGIPREATGTTAALAAALLPVPAATPSGTAPATGGAVESLTPASAGGAAS